MALFLLFYKEDKLKWKRMELIQNDFRIEIKNNNNNNQQ